MKGKIVFVPFRDMHASSTRLRCYESAKALEKLDWKCGVGKEGAETADVAIFQKRFSPWDLELAKKCKGKVIFDICDPNWLDSKQNEINILKMAEVADCVVTSSSMQADWFRGKGFVAYAIEDGFDFGNIPLDAKKEEKTTICWHGNRTNERWLSVIVEPLNRLFDESDLALKIIVDSPATMIPQFKFVPKVVEWKLDSYLAEIARCHIGVAPFPLDEKCSYKGPDKLIMYMALDLVAVVSPIQAYKEIIQQSKNGYIVRNNEPEDWYWMLKTLIDDLDKRSAVIQEGKQTALLYSRENTAKRWDKICQK